MKVMIDRADAAQVGDVVITPVRNDAYEREVHWIGVVLGITQPHEDITEFRVKLLAHCDGVTGETDFGIRHEVKVGIMRSDGKPTPDQAFIAGWHKAFRHCNPDVGCDFGTYPNTAEKALEVWKGTYHEH